MTVLIDIGNTQLKWAVSTGANQFSASGVIATEDSLKGAKLPSAIEHALREGATHVWVSSVAQPTVVEQLKRAWFSGVEKERFHCVAVLDEVAGITNAYQDLDKLGADRWVAAIGSRALVKSGDLIVIDAGTAVTVDWLDRDNVYQGGVILPGAAMMHDALVSRTAGIKSKFTVSFQIIGKTTSDCVNSGVSYGLIGAVERVVSEMRDLIRRPVKVVLTGGAAPFLSGALTFEKLLVSDLVLHGLSVLAKNSTGDASCHVGGKTTS